MGFGSRVWGLGCGVWGLGFGVWGLGLRVEGAKQLAGLWTDGEYLLAVEGAGCRVQGGV